MKNKLVSNSLNLTLLDANLYGGVTFQQEVNTGNDFAYGVVASASIKFTIDNEDGAAAAYIDQSFDWYCEMSGETDYAYKGTYIVKDISKNGKKATLTAYDCICKLDAVADAWVSGLTYPITLTSMVNSMGNKLGLSISALTADYRGSYKVYNNFMTRNITYRQILEYIAQIANVNFMADTSGQKDIIYKRYTETATTIDNSKYVKLTVSDYTTEPIDKVQIQSTFDDIGYVVGTGNNAYVITENPLFFTNEKQSTITSIASSLLAELKTITYTPMKFSTLKDFDINCGDIIKVNNIPCYIMKKSIKPSGCEFECVGNKRRETQKTEVNSAITALNNRTNELVRTVDETKSTLTEVKGSMKTIEDEQGNITEQMATLTTNVSEVKQTAQGLTSKVSSVETTLNNLDGEVTTLKTAQSTIEQKVGSITTKVEEVENTANGASQTASEARQTANSFSTKITQIENTANGAQRTASEANQTANSFSTRITTAEGNASTALQQSNKIAWVVKSGTDSSNFQLTDRTISLVSSNIDLTGYVTINSLKAGGTTTIDGGRITTGTISADRIDVSNLKVRNIYNADNKLAVTTASSYLYIGGDSTSSNMEFVVIKGNRHIKIGDIRYDTSNNSIYATNSISLGVLDSQAFGKIYGKAIYPGASDNCKLSCDASGHLLLNGNRFDRSLYDGSANHVDLINTTLTPPTTSYNLGGSSSYWGNAYITKLYLSSSCYITAGSSSSIKVGTTTISGSSGSSTTTVSSLTSGTNKVTLSTKTLAPSANGTFDLGSASYYWSNVYTYALWLKSGYNTVKLTCYSSNELAINGKKATHA